MLVTAEMMSPEFILRNFWWYHLKPEVEPEKFTIPEMENGNVYV